MAASVTAFTRGIAHADQAGWLYNRRWDLTFIILSAALVPIPLILHYGLGLHSVAVDILVALVVGGPHLYSTLTVTYLDRSFMKRYPQYVAGSFVIPVAVVGLALFDMTVLLTVFMFWASVHVLHQLAYIADCYRRRGGESLRSWSRMVDYAVIFTSLYPFATMRMVNDEFAIGGRLLLIPDFVKHPAVPVLAWVVFLVALGLFLLKTWHEVNRGQANFPRLLLIAVAVSIALVVPTVDNLDVAFQGMNVWHSFQYLALIWYVNKLRADRGEIFNGLVQRVAGNGRSWRFYVMNVGVTALAVVAIGIMFAVSGLAFEQCYYIIVLGSLLVHYYFDHFLFTRVGEVVR